MVAGGNGQQGFLMRSNIGGVALRAPSLRKAMAAASTGQQRGDNQEGRASRWCGGRKETGLLSWAREGEQKVAPLHSQVLLDEEGPTAIDEGCCNLWKISFLETSFLLQQQKNHHKAWISNLMGPLLRLGPFDWAILK